MSDVELVDGGERERERSHEGRFEVILADPPWRYDSGTAPPDREIENHYETMDLEAIKTLDVPAADDCVLYLWATAPKLAEAIDVLRAWGFEYKTGAIWNKKRLGMGYWFRIVHEHILVGVRGDATAPAPENRRSSIFEEEPREHSQKPARVTQHIEQAHPEASKIELFARDGRVGWSLWGNEAPESKQATWTSLEGGT